VAEQGSRERVLARSTRRPHHRPGHRSTSWPADRSAHSSNGSYSRLATGDPVLTERVNRLLERRPTFYERFVKPAFDHLIGGLLFLVAVPVLLVIALAVWITLGSPVLIRQDRVGRAGRPFGMLKFRTMRPDRRQGADPSYTGPERRRTHKSPFDPRHTPLGRRLRQNSLDELPQLFNILRGDMSLVGPRPELRSVADHYQDWQHLRHMVRPGLTGLWQITERANGTVMHEHTELDLDYVEQLSARTDFSILCRTPRALLKKEQVH